MIYPTPSEEYNLLAKPASQCKGTVVVGDKFLPCKKCIQFHNLKVEIAKWKRKA